MKLLYSLSIIMLTIGFAYGFDKINELTTEAAYQEVINTAKQRNQLTVIVFSSPSCSVCPKHEQNLNAVARKYPSVKFYKLNGEAPEFKNLKDKEKIQYYPTTYFISPTQERVVVDHELDQEDFTTKLNKLVTGKNPAPKVIPSSKRVMRRK